MAFEHLPVLFCRNHGEPSEGEQLQDEKLQEQGAEPGGDAPQERGGGDPTA